ncbi:MAG TPA: hypothetical protein VM283_08310 [Armatimonadota bacterium]|nr:hypothetical protein [Armatimonadota bacterium]
MLRTTAGIVLIALALGATVAAVAQDGVDIKVGNEIVARVRDTGQYGSVQARAEAINQAIGEALEGQDPAALEVSLKQVDGLWTVFIADKRIMSVLPAEAEANGMAPHVLGSIWVEKFKQALPSAQTGGTVTVVDLGNPLGDQPVTGTPTPTTTPTTTPATTGNVEVLEVPVEGPTPATGGAPAQPTVAAAQGARLLIIDAFNKIRAMPEDSYVRAREEKAGELLDNLLRVVSGGEMGAPEEPAVAVPDTGVGTITVGPPETATPPSTTTIEEIPLGPTTPSGTGTTTGGEITGSPESIAEIYAGIPEGDPTYAKVPQKRRIGKKFEAGTGPYLALKQSDPDGAKAVGELLGAARTQFAAGNFDVAEEYLDGALRMLGVRQW